MIIEEKDLPIKSCKSQHDPRPLFLILFLNPQLGAFCVDADDSGALDFLQKVLDHLISVSWFSKIIALVVGTFSLPDPMWIL